MVATPTNTPDPTAMAPVSRSTVIGSTLFVFLFFSLIGATYVAYDRKVGPFAPHAQAAAQANPDHPDTGGKIDMGLINELSIGMAMKDVKHLLGPPRHDEYDSTMMVLRELADEGVVYWSYETQSKAPLLLKFKHDKIIEIKTPQDFANMSQGL